MGQKVHPVGFRLGVIRTWDSKWFEEKNYAQWLHEDIKIRDFVKQSLNHAGVSRVEIERVPRRVVERDALADRSFVAGTDLFCHRCDAVIAFSASSKPTACYRARRRVAFVSSLAARNGFAAMPPADIRRAFGTRD